MASVVAELTVGIRYQGMLHGGADLNNITETGLYYVLDNVENTPSDGNIWYGSPLLVLKCYGWEYVTQLYISPAYNKIFKRSYVYGDEKWTSWTEF